jgi:phage shock protein PspC (stress-responsive transcriptional regulator)
MSDPNKKLYRSRNRMVGGVCAGLGEYLNIDPTVVRVIVVLGVFFTFSGAALVYLAMWLLIPEAPADPHPEVIDVKEE